MLAGGLSGKVFHEACDAAAKHGIIGRLEPPWSDLEGAEKVCGCAEAFKLQGLLFTGLVNGKGPTKSERQMGQRSCAPIFGRGSQGHHS